MNKHVLTPRDQVVTFFLVLLLYVWKKNYRVPGCLKNDLNNISELVLKFSYVTAIWSYYFGKLIW